MVILELRFESLVAVSQDGGGLDVQRKRHENVSHCLEQMVQGGE